MATDGAVFDEARLLEKLRAIEALFAGASTDGEPTKTSPKPPKPRPPVSSVPVRTEVGDGSSAVNDLGR